MRDRGAGGAWRERDGFSLVEVLVALALLALGLSLASSLLVRGELMHRHSRLRLSQAQLAARVLTELRLAETPVRLPREPVAPPAEPLLRYRAEVVAAPLPEDLRLVEVVVSATTVATELRYRGVVPASRLESGPQARPAAGGSDVRN